MNKKGQILDFGMTVVFLIVVVIIITIGIFTVLFAFGKQISFSKEYANIVSKPYSISESLLVQNIDDRSFIDHSLATAITKDPKKSQLTEQSSAESARKFIEKYEMSFYSIDIIVDSASVESQQKLTAFCGNIDDKTCGPGGDQPCIAYCDKTGVKQEYVSGPDRGYILVPSGCSSLGRAEYVKGNNVCQSQGTTCCAESNYNWQTRVFQTSQKTCANGKGICVSSCQPGRFHEKAFDSECPISYVHETFKSRNECCIPLHPDDVPVTSELGSEISIPLLYKKTKSDSDGVLGYLKIGVGND